VLTKVRVSGLPARMPLQVLIDHFATFGRVASAARGRDCAFPACFGGTAFFSLQLDEGVVVPHFLHLLYDAGKVSDLMLVHSDAHRRQCYKCGLSGHVG
jgi:hypothetical protein